MSKGLVDIGPHADLAVTLSDQTILLSSRFERVHRVRGIETVAMPCWMRTPSVVSITGISENVLLSV